MLRLEDWKKIESKDRTVLLDTDKCAKQGARQDALLDVGGGQMISYIDPMTIVSNL